MPKIVLKGLGFKLTRTGESRIITKVERIGEKMRPANLKLLRSSLLQLQISFSCNLSPVEEDFLKVAEWT